MLNKKLGNIFKGDKVIWMVFFFLCIISVIEVFSASSQLGYKNGSYFSPVIKHLGILLMGICCMIVTLNIKCKFFKIITPFLLIVSVATLVLVKFVGEDINGGSRWIAIFGFTFQPSEIAKGTIVLACAQIFSAMQTENGADRKAFKYVLWLCAIIIPLIMLENLSTAGLLFLVVVLMMFVCRVPISQIGRLLGVTAAAGILGIALIMLVGKDKSADMGNNKMTEQIVVAPSQPTALSKIFHRFDTWKSRIEKFNDSKKDVAPKDVDLDKDAQPVHANIAIASSNGVGVGPGNSVERDFLSQAFSDFIYAIIIEEMGFPGALFVALLYIILLVRTGVIAGRCENNFPAFLAMGLALLLVTQALFNMCVAVGIVPVTGQPLPLISKGGTSTIINCVYIGVILSISRSAKKKGAPSKEALAQSAVLA